MLASSVLVFFAITFSGVRGMPTARLHRRATAVAQSQIDSLIPFGQFARAAYCPTSKIQGWGCGQACVATTGFNPSLVGGDGDAIQNFYVGFWPQGNTVIVAHEGTDPTQLQSVLTDASIATGPLNSTLFPNADSNINVHSGFRDEHAKTADAIFGAVQSLLSNGSVTSVTTVGHSLGGALAILEAMSLRLRLPSSVTVSARTFGAPRVGDAGFANFFDSQVSDIQRTNNKQDLVPILPPQLLGFQHPAGEVHILADDSVVACSGNDNNSDGQCSDSSVPTIIQGSIPNHLGPYLGEADLSMGTIFCT